MGGDGDFSFRENKSGTVVFGFEDNSTWKPNKQQLNYLKERINFYTKYYAEHKKKYDFKNDWSNAIKQKHEDMLNEIPEYKSYYIDFYKSLSA